jgi:3-oxoacyl-[acyl-carrier-protein] synthase II
MSRQLSYNYTQLLARPTETKCHRRRKLRQQDINKPVLDEDGRVIKVKKSHKEGRRVVVTGLSIISPIGIGKTAFTEGLRNGKNGSGPIRSFDPSPLPCQIAAEIHDFEPSKFMSKKSVMRMGRSSQFAVAGAKMAIEDASLALDSEDPAQIGVIIGAAISGLEYASGQYERFIKNDGRKQVSPYMGIIVFAGACSSEVSIALNLKGLSHTISTGCAAGNDAVGSAYRSIRSGEADVMVTGGAEAPIVPIVIASFSSMKAVSQRNDDPQRASRPFDKERDGFVLGEGAGILVLEELERAKSRGARIYAEVLGYGATNDAFHMSQPDPRGLEAIRAVQLALRDAGLSPKDIEYVSAHGSSTPLNDKTETMVIRSLFHKHAYSDRFAISSTKSMTGHAMGAAASIGLVATLLAREEGFLPPTINYEIPDPECDPDLDFVPNEAKPRQPQFILSNAFGFGGKNACLVLGTP